MKAVLKKTLIIGVILILALSTVLLCACNDAKQRGEFFTVEQAYEQGLLTETDLLNLSYYLNGYHSDADFVPEPKNPTKLSKKTVNAIKETYAYDLRHEEHLTENAEPSKITVAKYYGTYNSLVAVLITDAYHYYAQWIYDVEIGGVKFRYYMGNEIMLWREFE